MESQGRNVLVCSEVFFFFSELRNDRKLAITTCIFTIYNYSKVMTIIFRSRYWRSINIYCKILCLVLALQNYCHHLPLKNQIGSVTVDGIWTLLSPSSSVSLWPEVLQLVTAIFYLGHMRQLWWILTSL